MPICCCFLELHSIAPIHLNRYLRNKFNCWFRKSSGGNCSTTPLPVRQCTVSCGSLVLPLVDIRLIERALKKICTHAHTNICYSFVCKCMCVHVSIWPDCTLAFPQLLHVCHHMCANHCSVFFHLLSQKQNVEVLSFLYCCLLSNSLVFKSKF